MSPSGSGLPKDVERYLKPAGSGVSLHTRSAQTGKSALSQDNGGNNDESGRD